MKLLSGRHLPRTPARVHQYYQLESQFIEINLPGRASPLKIHSKVAGSGPPLLLVHGLMTSSYSFRYVIPSLSENYRVYIPDMPGAGLSDSPHELPMDPKSVAEVLRLFIQKITDKPLYVVGNSLGGYQCLWMTLLYPELVSRLMVIHSPGIVDLRMKALHFALSIPGARSLLSLITRMSPERFVIKNVHYHEETTMSLEEAQEYANIFYNSAQRRLFFKILRDGLAPGFMKEYRNRLKAAPSNWKPIKLLWAREDVMVPPHFGPIYEELIPHAEMVWLEHASHFTQVDLPGRTIEEILAFDPELK